MSSSGDSGPGQREVAYRLFAAEFDDCSLSYAESDDERAPNYVVTPTGLRVNRLFAVGVLTETEAVNDETLRGRIVDPTGAFVTYAGQYQPDAQAFLDRTTPPAFVAITGKARTFEPEDSDRVFTSIRPESLSEVRATTRDRWVVSAAEATLRRIAICAAALNSPLDGEGLQHALSDAGIDDSLAAGIPRALEHYGTTTAYLAALRRLAIDALEVVADEREEVRSFDATPADSGEASLGPLPTIEGDLKQLQKAPPSTDAETPANVASDSAPPADEPVQSSAEADPASADTAGSSDTASLESTELAASSTTDSTESAEAVDTETIDEPTAGGGAETIDEPTSGGGGEAIDEPTSGGGAETIDEPTSGGDTTTEQTATTAEPSSDTEAATEPDSEPTTDEPAAEAGMYQLDDQERAELESEYDTSFSSGNEVDPAGQAGIDVPDVDELAEQAEKAAPAEQSTQADSPETTPEPTEQPADSLGSFEDELGEFEDETPSLEESTKPTSSDDSEAAEPASLGDVSEAAEPASPQESGDTETDESAAAEDIDLEETVVEVMAELDDGNGVEPPVLSAALVERYGVTETDIQDAIADALMGGRCYETGDDTLKAI